MLVIPAECEKGFMDRQHPMAPECAMMLQAVPSERRKGFVFRLNGRGHSGGRLQANAVSKTVSDIGKAAGVKVFTHPRTGKVKCASAHDLRRAVGSKADARAVDGTDATQKHRDDAAVLRRSECSADRPDDPGGVRAARVGNAHLPGR